MRVRADFRDLAVACVLGLATLPIGAQVVINELAYDDSGTDDEEFVELFNAGEEAVDLSGWCLATGDGLGPGPEYCVPEGGTIAAGGYFVVGSPLVPEVAFPLATTGLFGNGPAYILLMEPDGNVADGIAYEGNKGLAGFPDEASLEGSVWGNHVLVAGTRMSLQRWLDGRDTDGNDRDFGHLPWTPGASNNRAAPPLVSSGFDAGARESAVPFLPGSFVPGRIVDPTLVSPSNPGPIPESPDGGLALVAWDPAGGGNFAALEAAPTDDMFFEAWVYFDADPEPPGENETWSIGIRGTSGTFYNTPILFDANGNTGVTWTFQVTFDGATLSLVDEGHGGPAAERAHLGSIAIVPGENDGWRRLRLESRADRVTGYFDGTYGSTDDGVRIEGTLRDPGIGSFYIGYREALSNNASARPPTLDALVVGPLRRAGPVFERGNADAVGDTNLTDAVFLLNFLFVGGPEPPCEKSADTDDNGALEITDAVRVLNWLFVGGPPPESPSPACGPDPTPDTLTCEAFSRCAP